MAHIFNRGALGLTNGTINWTSDTIKARLSQTSESSINKDATAMTGLGLTATDVTLAGKSGPTEDTANDRIDYTCSTISFVAVTAGPECDKILVFKFVTNDAGSTPIALINMSPARTPEWRRFEPHDQCGRPLLPPRITSTGYDDPWALLFLTSTNAAWPWPSGVTSLVAEALGGGGAGGAATGNPATGGGGKGGSYAKVTITKGGEGTLISSLVRPGSPPTMRPVAPVGPPPSFKSRPPSSRRQGGPAGVSASRTVRTGPAERA